MKGVVTLRKSSKVSSQHYLLQGLAFAIVLHLALLAIQPSFLELSTEILPPLNVSIQLETTEATQINPVARKQNLQENIDLEPRIITTKAKVDDSELTLKPRIEISTSGESFQRFLQSETEHNIKALDNKLSEFSTTFKPYFEPPISTPDIAYREFQGALGGGQYKVYKNGKVTCELNMVPLSFDDHVYGAGGGTKDCTPKKKFDLTLRENTRD